MALRCSGPGERVMAGWRVEPWRGWGLGPLESSALASLAPLLALPADPPLPPCGPPPRPPLLTEVLGQGCTGTTCRGRARGPGLLPRLLLRPQVPPPGNLQHFWVLAIRQVQVGTL